MTESRQPCVVGAWRTPLTRTGAAQASIDAAGLAACVVAAGQRAAMSLSGVDAIILGNCRGPGGNLARVAALQAGLPVGVPGFTLDSQCGSGLAAVAMAADMVASGSADVVLAGGTESPSTQPHTSVLAGDGGERTSFQRGAFAPAPHLDPDMGPASDALARAAGYSREQLDDYAMLSWERTLATRDDGRLADGVVQATGAHITDDRVRRMRRRTLAKLPPAYGAAGLATAGNSCADADGAAAVLVVSDAVRKRHRMPGMKCIAWRSVGSDPSLPGASAGPAIVAAMNVAGVASRQVARLDVTEAFAAQVVWTAQCLGFDAVGADADRVNPDGGAIAMGHPWGASGAVVAARALHAAHRDGFPPVVSAWACAGAGGQGVAMMVEGVQSSR